MCLPINEMDLLFTFAAGDSITEKNGGLVELLFLFSTSIFSRFIDSRISIGCIYIEIALNLRAHISQIGNINEEFSI